MSNRLTNLNDLPENSGQRTVARTAVLMMVLTLLGKGLGFLRELSLADAFGTSYIVDAYDVAQRIPTVLLGGVVASLGIAYMPTFSAVTEKDGRDAGVRFTNRVLTLALIAASVIIALGFGFSPQLVALLAPRFEPKTAELAVYYLRIAFFGLLFSSTADILEAYLQYNGKFFRPILSGYMFDVGIIAVIFISARTDYHYLIFGTIVGYCLRFIPLVLSMGHYGLRYRPSLAFDESLRQVLRLSIPVFLGAFLTQINTAIDQMLASGLPEGSIAALNYGQLLSNLIVSLTASIIATVSYPKIIKAANANDWDTFNTAAQKSIAVAAIIAVPFCFGAISFSKQVVQVIYERGAFDETSTALTGSAFLFYSMGLAFAALNALLIRVFYSLQDTKSPVLCNAIGILCNIVLNLILIRSMQHRGLALATSIASLVSFSLLTISLTRKYPRLRVFPSGQKMLRVILAAALSVLLAAVVYRTATLVWMPRIVYLGIAVIAAVAVYFPLLKLLRIEEVDILLGVFRNG